jgi:hypothetical protein
LAHTPPLVGDCPSAEPSYVFPQEWGKYKYGLLSHPPLVDFPPV